MLSDTQLSATLTEVAENGLAIAASRIGLSMSQVRRRINYAVQRGILQEEEAEGLRKSGGEEVEIEQPPNADETAEELLARGKKKWARIHERAEALKLIPVKTSDPLPIGLANFGDLHVDDDGCNLPLLEAHTQAVAETDGMYAQSVGDLQNGWPGRLSHLYGHQNATARQAWTLLEWWLTTLGEKLLFVVSGNHDAWTRGVNGVDPISWVRTQAGLNYLYEPDGVRIALHHPEFERRFKRPITINARHDFRGKSIFNTAHGLVKAAIAGWRDDLLLAGHTHVSGYSPVKDPATGLVSHCLRIASYKHVDSYATQHGLPDQNIFECPVAIIDPYHEDPRHVIRIHLDPLDAADYLPWLRKKRAGGDRHKK